MRPCQIVFLLIALLVVAVVGYVVGWNGKAKKIFAWLPHKCRDGSWVWLGPAYRYQVGDEVSGYARELKDVPELGVAQVFRAEDMKRLAS